MLNPFEAILRVIQFIILLTFHEWGHAKAALMLGDPTARDEERLTFNPAAHIDILGTVILPLLGTLFRRRVLRVGKAWYRLIRVI